MPVTLNDYIFHRTEEPPSKVRVKIVIEYEDGITLEYSGDRPRTLAKLRKLIRAELPGMDYPILKEPGLPPMRVRKDVGRNPSHFGEALGRAA